jgi:hypothetical protein
MAPTEQVASPTIDSILEQLDTFHQRATYGAVAGVLNASPRNLMSGRSRGQRDSWIVAHGTGLPTGYSPDQVHPEIGSREQILSTAKDLSTWLESPS